MNDVRSGVLLALAILALSAVLLVSAPYDQLKRIPADPNLAPYTREQSRGRALYVSLGCVYCHSQQPRDPGLAPDGARGWGRASTPADYAYDYPHQLGTMRTGPDLFNIGARQPSIDWHLAHFYQPRSLVKGSLMPAYPFLFEEKARAAKDDVVVKLAPGVAPNGKVVVATEDALALTAYLLSLDHTYPSSLLSEAPSTDRGRNDG